MFFFTRCVEIAILVPVNLSVGIVFGSSGLFTNAFHFDVCYFLFSCLFLIMSDFAG